MINFISKAGALEKFSEVQSKIDLSETITYIVRLDSKSRLVLPLEIRESLGLDSNSNQKIVMKAFKDNESLVFKFEKADLSLGKQVSKNCWLL